MKFTLSKVFNGLVGAFILLLIFSLLASTYFLYFETPYLTYENIPFPVRMEQVKAGEVIPLTVKRCNSTDSQKTYTTTHTLQDVDQNLFYILPPVMVSIAPGCTTAISIMNIVPIDIPEGRYRVIGSAEIRGKLRTHIVDWYSETFTVKGRK